MERTLEEIDALAVKTLAFIAMALSLIVSMALFRERPLTSPADSADSHYGEGPIYAFDKKQRAKLNEISKKQGYVTLEQVDGIMEDGSGSPPLGSSK